MEPSFKESRPIGPRRLSMILCAVLLLTVGFMAAMRAAGDMDMPSWAIPVTLVAFLAVIAICALPRLDVECSDEAVRIRYALRRMEIPFGDIIDKKCGDINEIRNYGSWNLKGVKHMTYAAVGDERGVAMKLKGKRVVVVSCEDMERLFSALPDVKERLRCKHSIG